MKEKVLVIQRDAKEERFPLKKERTLIGRDSQCDIVWDEPEFSRQHIAIHYKHETVYIENISSGTSMKINNKEAEYAELHEGVEVSIGPYILKWIYAVLSEKLEKSNSLIQNDSGVKGFSQVVSNLENEPTRPSNSVDDLLQDNLPVLESTTLQEAPEDLQMNTAVAAAIAEDDTIAHASAAIGLMRVTSGEILGREIRLEHGKEWIVGRAKDCHVAIDNPKLSRHHFRILQISGGFRIQDLDSSYGVKINGVSVKEAPLKSFDNIGVGPVELQFVIVDKNMQAATGGGMPLPSTSALPALIRDDSPAYNQRQSMEKTNWPPAVNGVPAGAFQFSKPSLENSSSQGNFVSVSSPAKKTLPKEKIFLLFQKFKGQPKARKILIIILLLLIPLGLIMTYLPEAPETKVAQKVETPKENSAAKPEDNPAQSAEYSPEYQLKSPKEQAEIKNMYAQAESAREKGDWQRAHDLAKDIVSRVGKYKRTSEIIAEAQGYLTDLQIATLSRTDADAETAAAANKQKIEELLNKGEAAIREGRWDDAQEIYSKALLLDPKSEKATRGQYAAQIKDASALLKEIPIERVVAQDKKPPEAAEGPPPPPQPPLAPPIEAASIEGLSQQYQAAKQKIQEGAFRDVLPALKELKIEVERLISSEEGRNPTALLAEDKRNLRAKIIESLDLINDQFVLEYKTQLDDAQQAIANQKFVEARAVYDTLIKREPLFDEPRIEREKLYKKMMTDGQSAYREGLVSESVGDLTTALEYYEKSKSFFENIEKKEAQEYYAILDKKLRILKK